MWVGFWVVLMSQSYERNYLQSSLEKVGTVYPVRQILPIIEDFSPPCSQVDCTNPFWDRA